MLAGAGTAEAVAFLAPHLEDETLRRRILFQLEELGPKAAPATDALRGLIPTAGKETLRGILGVLASIGDGSAGAEEDLLELLGGDDRVDRHDVMRVLVAVLPREREQQFLRIQLLDSDPGRRHAAATLAWHGQGPGALRLVLEWLARDPDPGVSNTAARALVADRFRR
jgi:HEAT repeat protein